VSDSGGAYTSNAFEAVCGRLEIQHVTIVSTQGESYLNWMETHVNIQRRRYDDQFSWARTPGELDQRHRAFIQTYLTTAHQGLLKDQRLPPIPVEVLGTAQGRTYSPDVLAEKFAHAFFPRTTNRYSCVTVHRYHFYVEEGLPKTQIFLWIYGEQWRAVFDNVVLAEYRCRYDGQAREVADIREGQFYATHFASPQGALIPCTPQESLVVYRARSLRRRTLPASPAGQLCLFELLSTG
jgi:hypothetical protein